MTLEFLTRNWSLVGAGVLATAIVLFVGHRVYADSARGQLRARRRALKRRYREADRAQETVARATRHLEKLQARQSSVKPRHVAQAAEALDDARALFKIAADQVLIAENQVRKVILEEFPPRRHDALRARHLRSNRDYSKPFTF